MVIIEIGIFNQAIFFEQLMCQGIVLLDALKHLKKLYRR